MSNWVVGYSSVQAYWDFCKKNFIQTNKIVPFHFFSYSYHFLQEDPKWKEKCKFWDFFPVTFVFRIKDSNFWGINIHHLPVNIRIEWLKRLREINEKFDEIIPYIDYKEGDDYKILVPYPFIWKILKKTKCAIRQYRMAGVLNLRLVNAGLLDEVSKFMSSTYLNGTINDVNKRFRQYVPKQ